MILEVVVAMVISMPIAILVLAPFKRSAVLPREQHNDSLRRHASAVHVARTGAR